MKYVSRRNIIVLYTLQFYLSATVPELGVMTVIYLQETQVNTAISVFIYLSRTFFKPG